MLSKHKLDAARIDFHNSFPPTKRSKTCERIEFPSGEYISFYMLLLLFSLFSEMMFFHVHHSPFDAANALVSQPRPLFGLRL